MIRALVRSRDGPCEELRSRLSEIELVLVSDRSGACGELRWAPVTNRDGRCNESRWAPVMNRDGRL